MSLSSPRKIAEARAMGLVVPPDVAPSARASIDPQTGRLYSRTATETARTFYQEPGLFRSMAEAVPRKAARERLLQESGLSFRGGDWSERYERDLRLDAIARAYRDRKRREGERPGRLFEPGSEFREALGRLSEPVPRGTKDWTNYTEARKKMHALETLGMRPKGWNAIPGKYTKAQLAAAWKAAGGRPPQLSFVYADTGTRRKRR